MEFWLFYKFKKLKILPYIILPIQIGITFLQFKLRNFFSLCNCFKLFDNKNKNNNNFDYAKINVEQIFIENILIVKIQNNYDDSDDNSINNEKKEISLLRKFYLKKIIKMIIKIF